MRAGVPQPKTRAPNFRTLKTKPPPSLREAVQADRDNVILEPEEAAERVQGVEDAEQREGTSSRAGRVRKPKTQAQNSGALKKKPSFSLREAVQAEKVNVYLEPEETAQRMQGVEDAVQKPARASDVNKASNSRSLLQGERTGPQSIAQAAWMERRRDTPVDLNVRGDRKPELKDNSGKHVQKPQSPSMSAQRQPVTVGMAQTPFNPQKMHEEDFDFPEKATLSIDVQKPQPPVRAPQQWTAPADSAEPKRLSSKAGQSGKGAATESPARYDQDAPINADGSCGPLDALRGAPHTCSATCVAVVSFPCCSCCCC